MKTCKITNPVPATLGWDDATSVWYVEHWGEHALQQRIAELVHPREGDTVLDIGCGSGAAVRSLAKHLHKGLIIGIDPTPKMLELARRNTSFAALPCQTQFLHGAAEQLPLENQTVDLALAINSLHHWHDCQRGLAELGRVLKPGGRLLVIADLWDELPKVAPPPELAHTEPSPNDFKSLGDVQRELLRAGFGDIALTHHRSADISVSIISCHATTGGLKELR
jgi:SAM-dependent methyltransferase